ncbi:MAG: TonB-dependent receptor [Deltaproteobacteria bacterium]|nr:TonB-dependent receptor [Deltaproteobacteria bacterium]
MDPQRTSASLTIVEVGPALAASSDVAQVLESIPGTQVVSLGGLGGWSAVSIRGSTLRQVQVYLDGIPLNPDGADTVNLAELPLFAFKRVEVWRGTAPPAMDASPIGGVVNLVSADELPMTAMASSGSWGTHRMHATNGGQTELLGRPLSGTLVAELFHTGGGFDYFSDSATLWNLMDDRVRQRENNDKTQASAHARLRLGDGPARVTWMEAYLRREEGLPGTATHPTSSTHMDTSRHLSVLQAEGRLGVWRAEGRLWRTDRGEIYADPLGELGEGPDKTRGLTSRTGVLASVRGAPWPGVIPSLTLTSRQDRYREADLRADAVGPPKIRASVSASAGADLWLWGDRVRISPVAQLNYLDNQYLDTGVAGSTLLSLNPRAGMLLQLNPDWVLKANLSRSLRPPDFSELFGDRGVTVGNPDLLPERAQTADVGLRVEFRRAPLGEGAWELTGFLNHTQDLIVYIQNAQRTSIPVNFGLTRVRGVESGLTLSLWDRLDSRTALTLTDSTNLSPDPGVYGKRLPRLPGMELWQSTSLAWGKQGRIGHTWSLTRGNYWDATNWYLSAPRSLHGAFVRATPAPGWPSVELSVLNLANHIVEVIDRDPLQPAMGSRVAAITDFAGYPLPGRTAMITLRWQGTDAR